MPSLVSVAKLAFRVELSLNQSDYVRAGFSPCPACLNEGSRLLSKHRLNNKWYLYALEFVKSVESVAAFEGAKHLQQMNYGHEIYRSRLLSLMRGLKPAPTFYFNPTGATDRTTSFATESNYRGRSRAL